MITIKDLLFISYFKKVRLPQIEKERKLKNENMTKEEKQIVEKYKDKIYFKQESFWTNPQTGVKQSLGVDLILNFKTIRSIAKESGLKNPSIHSVYDRRDNCIDINGEEYNFYGEPTQEVLSIYNFCKRIANNQNTDWRNR